MFRSAVALACLITLASANATARGGAWDRIGPWNIFDGVDDEGNPTGEAGTLACAASPAGNPNLIYAGGQNNGVSSGIIKTVDGGKHWTRNSKGLWDTRILGVWLHPGDPKGQHVLAGTHTGIYESTDGASSWMFRNETKGWGNVMSFREGTIGGKPYILANSENGILTLPMKNGGQWQKIKAPGGIAPNAHLSVVTVGKQNTEVLTCIGGWGGGQIYYAALDSPSTATWTGPIKNSTGATIDCANAAVDPKDRKRFLYSKAGEYHVYESKDAGKTTTQIGTMGVYFVMIGADGAYYTATQDGAFVSRDDGKTWTPYHVIMHTRAGTTVDRVPHDYQRIVPDFRGDGIAFPSDQGLHIVDMANTSNYRLISAVGDMKNAMALSALISPSTTKPGSRNLVVNMWDWDVCMSHDDGATYAAWNKTEKSPGSCGEGGDGQGMGASGHLIMFHRTSWWASSDGGHNFVEGHLPGGASSFDYIRKSGSRSEPSGICFALLDAPPPTPPPPTPPPTPPPAPTPQPKHGWASFQDTSLRCSGSEFKGSVGTFNYWNQCEEACKKKAGIDFAVWRSKASGGDNTCYTCDLSKRGPPSSWKLDKTPGSVSLELLPGGDAFGAADANGYNANGYSPAANEQGDDKDDGDDEMDPRKVGYAYTPGVQDAVAGNVKNLMTSKDFGTTWKWEPLPAHFQAGALTMDPTNPAMLFGLTPACLAHSTDKGKTWSACSTGKGLIGRLSKLLIKDSKTMFMLRSGAVPLRTTDGGSTWTELTKTAPLFKYGATMDGSISWTGKTLVLSGVDLGAINRGEYGTAVWKSSNDGNDWTDETGDLVTISPGPGVWYEKDFYFVTRGEGVMVKRNFEA
jgi:photosystem II stability/assembly factor-like uncharacterized protein